MVCIYWELPFPYCLGIYIVCALDILISHLHISRGIFLKMFIQRFYCTREGDWWSPQRPAQPMVAGAWAIFILGLSAYARVPHIKPDLVLHPVSVRRHVFYGPAVGCVTSLSCVSVSGQGATELWLCLCTEMELRKIILWGAQPWRTAAHGFTLSLH